MRLTLKHVTLQLWDEGKKCQRFTLPCEVFENIEAWVHEFSELGVWYAIKNKIGLTSECINNMLLSIPTKTYYPNKLLVTHIMVSFHTISTHESMGFYQMIGPDEFYNLIFHRVFPD